MLRTASSQKGLHRASTKIVASDGLAALGAGDDHAAEALTHVSQAGAEGKNGHALACNRDVETGRGRKFLAVHGDVAGLGCHPGSMQAPENHNQWIF